MKAKNMLGNQSGFTLIEIIAVLIIIGILAAVAVPKYFDLTQEAEQGAVNAQANNLNSGSALNFAKYKLDPNGTEAITGIGTCNAASQLVEDFDGTQFSIGTSSTTTSARFTLLKTDGSTPAATTCYVTKN